MLQLAIRRHRKEKQVRIPDDRNRTLLLDRDEFRQDVHIPVSQVRIAQRLAIKTLNPD
jgi:hypothetical protein